MNHGKILPNRVLDKYRALILIIGMCYFLSVSLKLLLRSLRLREGMTF